MEKLWENPESDQLASSCQKRCCLHQRVLNTLVLIKVFIISWVMLILSHIVFHRGDAMQTLTEGISRS